MNILVGFFLYKIIKFFLFIVLFFVLFGGMLDIFLMVEDLGVNGL